MSEEKANLVTGDNYQGGQPPAYHATTPPVQTQPYVAYGQHVQQRFRPPMENPPNDYMALSILACLCCCWPLGLVAIVKAFDVRSAIEAGDRRRAEASSLAARNFSIAAAVFGVIVIGLTITLYMLVFRDMYDDYDPY